MFRLSNLVRHRVAVFAFTSVCYQRSTFHPFSQKDEDELVQVIKTKPRHVLKYVRQQVWKSRKRELQFRNSVTQLMIILQEYLRKQLIDPAQASAIMEGVLEECVTFSQHDMAHLLFRALLRFRKYGCTISVRAIRSLFESYKTNDSQDLMLQLANELKEDASLRPVCVAAFLFAGKEAETDALLEGLTLQELRKDDIVALIAGYEKLKKTDKIGELFESVDMKRFSPEELSDLYAEFFRALFRLDNDALFTKILQFALENKVSFNSQTFALILRQKMRHVTSPEEIQSIENDLKEIGYIPDVTGNSIVITAYARLMHFGDRGSEELMLSKVDTLLSSIESRLKQGDPDMDISAVHIRAVFRGYGAAGKGDSIKNAWDRIKPYEIAHDLRVFNELFKWFSLMGNVKHLLQLKEEMESMKINADSVTYTWMIRALGRYYPRHVLRLYEEIQSRHVRPDVQLYTSLIGVLGDLHKKDEVEALWSEMLKREEAGTLQLSPFCFAVRIRVSGRDTEKAMALYEEAKKRNFHEHPHVQTSLLHQLASSPDGEKKVEAFLTTQSPWTTDVYNVLLHLYSKRNKMEQFNATLDKMKTESVAMNDVTFGTLITAFSRWGDQEKMREVIQILKDHEGEVSPAFYSVLASSLQRMGDEEGVSEAWEDLVASKLFPDTDVYNQFLSLYSRQHNIKKMQGVLDNMMKQIPPNPVTATTVLDMLGKSGRVTEMESLFEDMKRSPDTTPTSVTYHQLLNTYAKTGDIVKMESVYEEMRSKGHEENAVTYNILTDGYGRSKSFEQMEEVMQKRKQNGIPVDDLAYCIMLSTYGKAKLESEVKRVFSEAVHAAETNPKLLTRRIIWSAIDAFCRCGKAEEIEECVRLLKEKTTTKTLRVSDANTLIPYYCRLANMEKAEEMVGLIASMNGEVSYHSLNAMARGYARMGRFDKAVETLHTLRDNNWAPDASTALSLSGSFLKAGLHEQARQIVEWRRQYTRAAGEVENISVK